MLKYVTIVSTFEILSQSILPISLLFWFVSWLKKNSMRKKGQQMLTKSASRRHYYINNLALRGQNHNQKFLQDKRFKFF